MTPNRIEPNAEPEEFSRWLRSQLALHGWSAAKAADLIGVSQKTMHSWIHAKTCPPSRNEITTREDVEKSITDTAARIKAAKIAAQARIDAEQAGNATQHAEDGPQGFA